MPRRDKKPSKYGRTSEERMEKFRKSITKDFGNMNIRDEHHLKELMRERTVNGEKRGYRKFVDKRTGEEKYGYPTATQTQIAWDHLNKMPTRGEVLEQETTWTLDSRSNRHANFAFEYEGKNYKRGQFIPKKFR